MSATLPSQSIFWVLSSGLAVQQSMIVWMPTRAAGMLVGSLRSADTVVAPQSLRKSAGFCLGLTMQRTYPKTFGDSECKAQPRIRRQLTHVLRLDDYAVLL